MTEELKTIETVDTSPFKRMVMTIGELPTSFVDSMTYYELLAWLCNYLQNTVIPTVNNNAEAVKELQGLFIELKTFVDDYFDNLDVQEEINNKLDDMAEAGTLQEIITTYIQSNVAWTFDTVADMKVATNLVAGSYARTLGFHSVNDGGGALYIISDTGTANEMDVIAIGTLYATLIKPATITPEIYGAYGDGTHDDTTCVQRCLSENSAIHMTKTYLINSELSFNGAIFGEGKGRLTSTKSQRFEGAFLKATTNIEVNGLYFDCGSNVPFTVDDKFLNYNEGIIASGTIKVSDCEFHNLYEKFIAIKGNTTEYVDIHDNLFSTDNKTNVYMSNCIEMFLINNDKCIVNIHNNTLEGYEYSYVGTYDNDTNINAAGIMMSNLNVSQINIDNNTFSHLGKHGSVSGNEGMNRMCVIDAYYNVKPLNITNNKIVDCHWVALRLHGTDNAFVDNNLFTVARACSEPLILISDAYNTTGEAPVGCNNVTISNNRMCNKDKIFQQGIFINSYSPASLAEQDGFYGSVNNLVIVNNDIEFCAKYLFTFDYSLKTLFFENNNIRGDFSGVTGLGTHYCICPDVRGSMASAEVGKDFSSTILNIKNNSIKLDCSNIYTKTDTASLATIFAQLTSRIEHNDCETTGVGYVMYGYAGADFNVIGNIIKANVGGVNTCNKAMNNVVFYATSSAGIYNATTKQNNSEYTN